MNRNLLCFLLLLLFPQKLFLHPSAVFISNPAWASEFGQAQEAQKDHAAHAEWSYSGPNGPEHWAEKFPDCGRNDQSPIDIQNYRNASLPAIEFHYKPSPLWIFNNGHTIQIAYPAGKTPENTIAIAGE